MRGILGSFRYEQSWTFGITRTFPECPDHVLHFVGVVAVLLEPLMHFGDVDGVVWVLDDLQIADAADDVQRRQRVEFASQNRREHHVGLSKDRLSCVVGRHYSLPKSRAARTSRQSSFGHVACNFIS